MASNKGSAYGDNKASDTSFRKNWDVEEYAAKAKVREDAEKEESKARWEAKQAGKKYYKPLTGDEAMTSARTRHTDFSAQVGKTSLVAGGSAVGKRGKGPGIYCEACDLNFKDNIQWVEHINSKQHLHAIGQTDEVRKASAQDVHERIERLWLKKQEEKLAATTSLQERLAIQAVEDEKEREEKRLKRQEAAERKRKEQEAAKEVKMEYGEDVRVEGEHDEDDMMAMMGFAGGFGSSKK